MAQRKQYLLDLADITNNRGIDALIKRALSSDTHGIIVNIFIVDDKFMYSEYQIKQDKDKKKTLEVFDLVQQFEL